MHLSRHRALLGALLLCLFGVLLTTGTTAWGHGRLHRALRGGRGDALGAQAPQCVDPAAPAERNPANPLMLARPPAGGDVLSGAPFFTAGPARGSAAGAVAQLLGIGVGEKLQAGSALGGLPDTLSWQHFLATTVLDLAPLQPPAVQENIARLEQIADQPTPMRISAYSGGGSATAVYGQTRKLFCTILQADPGTIPIMTTYFAHAELGGCSSASRIAADVPRFRGQINAMAAAIGRRRAALFIEPDAVGSSRCMARRGAIGAWEHLIRYEALKLEALPHTVVYIEGGYSDSNTPAYAARRLDAMGVRQVQGFYTNDTHLEWTSRELRYARMISRRTGGSHFVINTSANGRGPLLNPHPRTQGVEDLCNPPGRGLGIPDTTAPGLDPHLDGLLWLVPPGNSSGSCHGGPPSGTFWTARAEHLAADPNAQLGPGYPSLPY